MKARSDLQRNQDALLSDLVGGTFLEFNVPRTGPQYETAITLSLYLIRWQL
jgi:hypothetical protein